MAPSLDELLMSGLGGILQQGGTPLEEDLYQRQARAERESTFGRGLGISSVTRDALAKARMDAAMAAQQAQLAALGQAAGITQGNANRAQQESQFGRTQALQRRQLDQQKDLANQQMLAGGIGAGAGALAQLGGAAFGPEIRSGLRGFFGQPPLRQDANSVPSGERMPVTDTIGGGQGSDFLQGGGGLDYLSTLGSGGDFSMPDMSSYGSLDLGDFGGFGGLDLSGLYDFSFDPYQVQDWGWY